MEVEEEEVEEEITRTKMIKEEEEVIELLEMLHIKEVEVDEVEEVEVKIKIEMTILSPTNKRKLKIQLKINSTIYLEPHLQRTLKNK